MVRTSLWARAMIVLLWPRRMTRLSYLARKTVLVRLAAIGGLAQKITNDRIAVAGLTALRLAGRLVAGTQGAPRRQPRRGRVR
jgi:hypothetical protein